MDGIDFKQIPNLAQVYTIALLPLLFVALGLVGLIFVLWMKVRIFQIRLSSLEADIKTIFDKSKKN